MPTCDEVSQQLQRLLKRNAREKRRKTPSPIILTHPIRVAERKKERERERESHLSRDEG